MWIKIKKEKLISIHHYVTSLSLSVILAEIKTEKRLLHHCVIIWLSFKRNLVDLGFCVKGSWSALLRGISE